MAEPTLLNVSRPRSFGYGLALGNRLFRLAVGPGRGLSIETAPLEAPRVNTTSSPEEASPEFGLTFARSQFDGGQGLLRAHTEDAEPNRYWDSRDVSVRPPSPGEFPAVRLLHTTEQVESSSDTDLHLAYDGSSLYLTEGAVLRRTDDPTASSPTWADDNPDASETVTDVLDVAVLGTDVYAVVDDGIHKKTGSSWAHWADNPASTTYERVWAVKGRVVASDGTSLYEVTTSGAAPSSLVTLSTGLEWTDVCDGGSHILAAASDGYVYAFATDSGSMALEAQTLFEGEVPRTVGQTQGIVAIGTSSGTLGRWYVGALTEAGNFGNSLQLVKEWSGQSPRATIGTRSALFTAVPDGTDTFLWRYDVTTAGVSRDLTLSGVSANVWGLADVGGTKFAAVDSSGVYRETSDYATSGYLIGPLGDFYSASDKSWIGARLETGDLTDTKVELFYTVDPDALEDPDSSAWVRVASRTSGSGDPGEQTLSAVTARSLAGMVKLTSSADQSATPAVQSFSFRAYPSSGDEDVIVTVPVNVSDQIERRGRHRVRVKGRGASEYAALTAFEGKPVLLQLFQPDLMVRGLVEQVGTPIQSLTHRGSATVVSQVRVRGRKVESASVTSGVGTFATRHLFATSPTFGASA